MHYRLFITFLLTGALLLGGYSWMAHASAPAEDGHRLAIVWTSGDPDVAHRMALMYAHGAIRQKWFGEVHLIIWGPSQRLVVGDKDIRAYIDRLREAGVKVEACLACSDSYGVTEDLRKMGLEVRYMGAPLSNALKDDSWQVITF